MLIYQPHRLKEEEGILSLGNKDHYIPSHTHESQTSSRIHSRFQLLSCWFSTTSPSNIPHVMMMLKSPWTSEGFGLEIAMLWLGVTREIEKMMRECVERRRHDDENDVLRGELNGMNDESVRLDCTFVLSFVCDLTFLFPSLLSTCLFTPVWVLFDLFLPTSSFDKRKETLWLTEKIEKRLSETRAAKKAFLAILRRNKRIAVVRSHPRNGMKLNTQKTLFPLRDLHDKNISTKA